MRRRCANCATGWIAIGLTAPLFDSERYARNIEAAYAHMVRLRAAGRPPEAFAVADLVGEDEAPSLPR